MKKIERSEILALGEYEAIREPFRRRVIALKKPRRLALGDEMSIVFENHDTMLMQVQEMLRTERITSEKAVAHELETYNELVPGDAELSATLFIEIPDTQRREELLTRLCAIEEHVVIEIGTTRSRATFEEGRRDRGRAAAVQYLKFPLAADAIAALRAKQSSALVFDHPSLKARFELPIATVASLAQDVD